MIRGQANFLILLSFRDFVAEPLRTQLVRLEPGQSAALATAAAASAPAFAPLQIKLFWERLL